MVLIDSDFLAEIDAISYLDSVKLNKVSVLFDEAMDFMARKHLHSNLKVQGFLIKLELHTEDDFLN